MSELPKREPQESGHAPKVPLTAEQDSITELAELAEIEYDFQLRTGFGGNFRTV